MAQVGHAPASRHFLITGATGNLGFAVAQRLLRNSDDFLTLLVRPGRTALLRWQLGEAGLLESLSRLEIVEHLLDPIPYLPIPERFSDVTDIVHCAANVRWRDPPADIFLTNVGGAQTVIQLAEELTRRAGRLSRLILVSTAYVQPYCVGTRPRSATAYELSKILAERLANQARVPVTVVRPSTIVGDSTTGRIENFTGLYFLLKILSTRNVPVFPGRAGTLVDMVPVDFVAREIIEIHRRTPAPNLAILAAGRDAPTMMHVWETICGVLDKLAPLPRRRRCGRLVPPALAAPMLRGVGQMLSNKHLLDISAYMPYVERAECLRSGGFSDLHGFVMPNLEQLLTVILQYALAVRFRSAERRFHELAHLMG